MMGSKYLRSVCRSDSYRLAAICQLSRLDGGTAAEVEAGTPARAGENPRRGGDPSAEDDCAGYVEATGTVRAALSAQLASQVMGTITRVNVHEGDRVRRGEVLVSIDEAQQQAAYAGAKAGLRASQESIAAADADYALAESTMKRYQMLYDKKSVSPQEYDEVKTRLAAAKARRDAAHAGRAQAEAGVIAGRHGDGFHRKFARRSTEW